MRRSRTAGERQKRHRHPQQQWNIPGKFTVPAQLDSGKRTETEEHQASGGNPRASGGEEVDQSIHFRLLILQS
ncbi:MAG: hypothetical protein L6W00_28065 [Lentisphaeria bacterium]|nr:MAG: hypothetical protein L6W00_28065 [Lentisphaeria bacterium]